MAELKQEPSSLFMPPAVKLKKKPLAAAKYAIYESFLSVSGPVLPHYLPCNSLGCLVFLSRQNNT